jgi:hypothetical protein
MKRLLGIAVLLAALVGALSSHSKNSASTSASSEPQLPASPTASAPQPAKPRAAHVSYSRCDQNIRVGPRTTCAFADNVFRAFASKVSAEGSEPGNYLVRAPSQATGRTYEMSCRTTSGTTRCTGGDGAVVRFPLYAAEVYSRPAPQPEPAPAEESDGEAEESEPQPTGPSAECTNGTYVNSAGNTVCRPEERPTVPSGATAKCEDGTYSFSESRSGTCSHHGGVGKWL